MLRFVDSFDSYTATSELNQKWRLMGVRTYRAILHEYNTGGWEWNATEGVNGGGCIKSLAATAVGKYLGRQVRPYGAVDYNRLGTRDLLWFKVSVPPLVRVPFLQWYQEDNFSDSKLSNIAHLDLDIDTNGFLIQRVRGTDTTPGADLFTVATNVCDNLWHCVERYWKLATSAGEFRLVLDGVEQYNQVGLTGLTGFLNLMLFRTLGVNAWIDDLIVWDDIDGTITSNWNDAWEYGRYAENFLEQGNDNFNGPLGRKQITTLRPVATSVGTFSPEASNNTLVDEIAHDGDTTYVFDNALGSRDNYQLGAMNPAAVGITAVVLNFQNRMREPGNVVLQPEANQGGTFELGFRRLIRDKFIVKPTPGVALLASYGPYADIGTWVPYTGTEANTTLSIVDGELRIANNTGATASIGATLAVPTVIGTRYLVDVVRSPIAGQAASSGVLVRASATDISSGAIKSTSIPFGIDGEISFIAVTTTTYIIILFSAAAGTFAQFQHVAVGEEFSGTEYSLLQWAMKQDPVTLAPWTVAGIDSARFGMRISL